MLIIVGLRHITLQLCVHPVGLTSLLGEFSQLLIVCD